jgi:TLC domain
MGYHIGQLVTQIVFEDWKKSDFIEMTLHHAVTVYLFGFSYMGNFIIGGPVTFLHNWADVAISFTRIWNETIHYKTIAMYSFIISQLVWGYTRLYVFGQLIVSCMTLEVFLYSSCIQPIFGFLLGSLYVLHVYWLTLMLRITYKTAMGQDLDDSVSKIKTVKERKE